jgi:cysteine desulfurase
MIYLDNNSTTPVDEKVLEKMLPYFSQKFGNAASVTHSFGWLAKDGVATAIKQVAELLHCDEQEIVFTSGATESINLAIQGVFEIYKNKGNHIITCKTEHKAVLDTCQALEKKGARITYLEVDKNGLVNLDQLQKEISSSTILVSIMYANNETGCIQPIEKIAEITHMHGSIFMSDATQAVGKLPIDLNTLGIDLIPFSAHKFYGPKGVGGLYIRRKKPRVILAPTIFGGGHQRGLRSGTLNVPGIVGLGAACALAKDEMESKQKLVLGLRNQLEKGLLQLPNVSINSLNANRLYNTSNICFKDIAAVDLIRHLKNKIAVATGSACTAEDQNPSHVLSAMGLTEKEAFSAMRFSLGKYNTKEEIEATVGLVRESVLGILHL